MADFETNQEYYLPPRPVLPTYAPAELRAGEISQMPPMWTRPMGTIADAFRGIGNAIGVRDFDKRTMDSLNLLAGMQLATAPARAAAPFFLDSNIASTLSRYAPREATRTGEAIAGGADDYWNTAHALSRNDGVINAARPSNEVSNGVTRPWLRDGSMPRTMSTNENAAMSAEDAAHQALIAKNAREKNELAQKLYGRSYDELPTRQQDHVSQIRINEAFNKPISAVEAAERAVARNPNDERAKYMLAMERQREAAKAAEFDRNVNRFERALEGDPRNRFTIIEGGKRASGGAVDDPIQNALRIARSFIDKYG